jgi:hypothetical protein
MHAIGTDRRSHVSPIVDDDQRPLALLVGVPAGDLDRGPRPGDKQRHRQRLVAKLDHSHASREERLDEPRETRLIFAAIDEHAKADAGEPVGRPCRTDRRPLECVEPVPQLLETSSHRRRDQACAFLEAPECLGRPGRIGRHEISW